MDDLIIDDLSVSCPYCGAIPGRPCKRVKGHDHPMESPRHHHRYQKARQKALAEAASLNETKENK